MRYNVNIMQSIMVVSKDKKMTEEYLMEFCKEHNINLFDIVAIEQDKNIGIETIRDIQKKIFLTPLKSKTKAIIVKNADTLTLEAQNALLKILEEPPENAVIILQSAQEDVFLETIYSRCKLVKLNTQQLITEKEDTTLSALIEAISKSGFGVKLKLAQDIGTNREEASLWLEKMIIVARDKLLNFLEEAHPQRFNDLNHFSKPDPSIPLNLSIIVSLQKTHTIIKTTNVNPRFILENLFLSL